MKCPAESFRTQVQNSEKFSWMFIRKPWRPWESGYIPFRSFSWGVYKMYLRKNIRKILGKILTPSTCLLTTSIHTIFSLGWRILLFECTFLAFNYVLSCICPLKWDCKLPESEDWVCMLRQYWDFKGEQNTIVHQWCDSYSIFSGFSVTQEQVFSLPFQMGEKHKLEGLSWKNKTKQNPTKAWVEITVKILTPTFWQTAIVLGHSLGRIPLGNVGGIIILSQKQWIVICFFPFKKMNVERDTSDKQWNKDIISGEGMRCRKTRII